MQNGMTEEDLAKFIAEARKHFRGTWDEVAFGLARGLIAKLRPSLAAMALHHYAAEFGGANGRFYYGQFRKFVDRLQPGDEEWRGKQAAKRRTEEEQLERLAAAGRAHESWRRCEQIIMRADPAEVRSARAFLDARGWDTARLGDDLDGWPRSAILAVSDLVAGVPVRDLDGREMEPRQFYDALRPPRIAQEAVDAIGAREPARAPEPPTSDSRAVSGHAVQDPFGGADLDEIPFMV